MGDERQLAGRLVAEIEKSAARIGRPVRIMEVCGTHTVELRKQGIHSLLPPSVTLISGPGCPVCVTPTGYVDNALALAESGAAMIASFGDMLKVPGSTGRTLSSAAGQGRVKLVYSPSDLLEIAAGTQGPLVFLAVGFETTIPTIVSALAEARDRGIGNLSLYTSFKTVPPALRFLLANPEHGIDGFLLPGHVSVIIGSDAYGFLEKDGGRPGVVTGFDALDMLLGILLVLRQIAGGLNRVENAYPRAVKPGETRGRASSWHGCSSRGTRHGGASASSRAPPSGFAAISRRPMHSASSPFPLPATWRCPAASAPVSWRAWPSRLSAGCSARAVPPMTRWVPAWSPRRAPARRTSVMVAGSENGKSKDTVGARQRGGALPRAGRIDHPSDIPRRGLPRAHRRGTRGDRL